MREEGGFRFRENFPDLYFLPFKGSIDEDRQVAGIQLLQQIEGELLEENFPRRGAHPFNGEMPDPVVPSIGVPVGD